MSAVDVEENALKVIDPDVDDPLSILKGLELLLGAVEVVTPFSGVSPDVVAGVVSPPPACPTLAALVAVVLSLVVGPPPPCCCTAEDEDEAEVEFDVLTSLDV